MEINQAAQTFLLFFFIFITSLLGFAFYVKYSKKTSKISLIDAVQTALLIVGIFTLLVFGGSYHFVLSDIDPSEQPLRDALSITAGFFGGFATLTAAFIASRLFNDWKEQHNKTVEKEMAWVVIQKFDAADLNLSRFQDDFKNFAYKCNFPNDMSDEELQNLDRELNTILNSIRGVSLNVSSFLESVRKYSLIAEKTYFDNITNDVKQINSIIFNIQNHKARFPGSMSDIENAISKLKERVADIERVCINKILNELKAIT